MLRLLSFNVLILDRDRDMVMVSWCATVRNPTRARPTIYPYISRHQVLAHSTRRDQSRYPVTVPWGVVQVPRVTVSWGGSPGTQSLYPGGSVQVSVTVPGGQSRYPVTVPGGQSRYPSQYPGVSPGTPSQHPGVSPGTLSQFPGGQSRYPVTAPWGVSPGTPSQYPGGSVKVPRHSTLGGQSRYPVTVPWRPVQVPSHSILGVSRYPATVSWGIAGFTFRDVIR